MHTFRHHQDEEAANTYILCGNRFGTWRSWQRNIMYQQSLPDRHSQTLIYRSTRHTGSNAEQTSSARHILEDQRCRKLLGSWDARWVRGWRGNVLWPCILTREGSFSLIVGFAPKSLMLWDGLDGGPVHGTCGLDLKWEFWTWWKRAFKHAQNCSALFGGVMRFRRLS